VKGEDALGKKWGWFMVSVGMILGAVCIGRSAGLGRDLGSRGKRLPNFVMYSYDVLFVMYLLL
jgi:hypothetical protein